MDCVMAFETKRRYIQRLGVVVVVILLCLSVTVFTCLGGDMGKFAINHGLINNLGGRGFFWIVASKSSGALAALYLAFFSAKVFFTTPSLGYFAFATFSPSFTCWFRCYVGAVLTITLQAVLAFALCIKFTRGLGLFTFTTCLPVYADRILRRVGSALFPNGTLTCLAITLQSISTTGMFAKFTHWLYLVTLRTFFHCYLHKRKALTRLLQSVCLGQSAPSQGVSTNDYDCKLDYPKRLYYTAIAQRCQACQP